MGNPNSWHPPDFNDFDLGKQGEIKSIFSDLFSQKKDNDLADKISHYWISKLAEVWTEKSMDIKEKDVTYDHRNPLCRVEQKTVLISYADSVHEKGKATLTSLEGFLSTHFPAVRGLHILPACEISAKRFNDGGFSQIRRDRIHAPYGTNKMFEAMMGNFYSMADFVLNHVDIENPNFFQYLNGDNQAGECFFVFSEEEYRKRSARGDFNQIFRPRPFPLFTIFRRKPKGMFANMGHEEKTSILNQRFEKQELAPLPAEVINIVTIFNKIKNDQMLLDDDYRYITQFREFLKAKTPINPDDLFVISETQEIQQTPYVFSENIQKILDLLFIVLPGMGITGENARLYTEVYQTSDTELFGESIRALTTFSHVQVDLNTSTFEGLKLLIDDFSWYLKMDLKMLRLDAANFAFKKWGTSCFGLPEGSKLLKILYLSMEIVAPRIVPNLEVNAPLGMILGQMADKQAPPPMMYDFHLASMLPIVFNTADTLPLLNIFNIAQQYDIPYESIRFSLDESHDGKSVNGSGGADYLLTYAQRENLVQVVRANNGFVKYKSSSKGQYPIAEFKKVCMEAGLDFAEAAGALFKDVAHNLKILYLKEDIQTPAHIAQALKVSSDRIEKDSALKFFITKIINGKEPYELCVSTRDSLVKLDNPVLEVKRYLAFKTLAFALMGRNVKSIYFNDLMGLGNDNELVKKTGELRNIKRTKSDRRTLDQAIGDLSCRKSWIAKNMNNTIALVDSDPSFSPFGNKNRLVVDPDQPSVALIQNSYKNHNTVVVVNTANKTIPVQIKLTDYGLDTQNILVDNITGKEIERIIEHDTLTLEIGPFGRFWIKPVKIEIDQRLLVDAGSEENMEAYLKN